MEFTVQQNTRTSKALGTRDHIITQSIIEANTRTFLRKAYNNKYGFTLINNFALFKILV
jgi:hypothetical protein